jgi:hypothetical protein
MPRRGEPKEKAHLLFYLDSCVAFPLAVDAAAVLLAVEVKRFGNMAAVRIPLAEVGVEEFNMRFLCYTGADFADKLMLLMGTDEQGGGKGAEVLFSGNIGSFPEAHLKAMAAAVSLMPDHPPEVIYKVIAVADNQREFQSFCQRFHGV